MIPFVRLNVACLQPVPWSAPQVFMKATKAGGRYKSAARNPEMEQWEAYVRLHAVEKMEERQQEITLKPVYASIRFFRRTENPELLGTVWFNGVAWKEGKDDKPGSYVKTGETVPDVDNLAKSTLDAMQGVVYGNDVQVCCLCVSRQYESFDGAEIIINVLEDDDEI